MPYSYNFTQSVLFLEDFTTKNALVSEASLISNYVHFQKISIFPSQKRLECPGGGRCGVCSKTKYFKEMYETLLEFSKGWGSSFYGRRMDIFGNHTITFWTQCTTIILPCSNRGKSMTTPVSTSIIAYGGNILHTFPLCFTFIMSAYRSFISPFGIKIDSTSLS